MKKCLAVLLLLVPTLAFGYGDYGVVKVISGTAGSLNADAIASTEVSTYRWADCSVYGTWSGTMTLQQSPDNFTTTFATLAYSPTSSVGLSANATSNTILSFAISAKYFRFRMTSYTSGIATVDCRFYYTPQTNPSGVAAPTVTVSQGATTATGSLQVGGGGNTVYPTAVADGQMARFWVDHFGRQIVYPYAPRTNQVKANITLTTTTETTLFAANATRFVDIAFIEICTTQATAGRIDLRDATGGSVIASLWVNGNSCDTLNPNNVLLEQTTINNNWTVQLGTALTDFRVFAIAVLNQ